MNNKILELMKTIIDKDFRYDMYDIEYNKENDEMKLKFVMIDNQNVTYTAHFTPDGKILKHIEMKIDNLK